MKISPRISVTVSLLEAEDAEELMTVFVEQQPPRGWTAQCVRHTSGGSVTLGRVFHHASQSVALGKMLQWIERHYGPTELVSDSLVLQDRHTAAASRLDSGFDMEPPEIRPLGKE